MNDPFATLDDTQAFVWEKLKTGAEKPGSPAHLLTLATVSKSGAPRVRILVLRAVDVDAKQLILFTHGASEKIEELGGDPRAELLFWDADAALQVRLRARITVSNGDPDEWSAMSVGRRANYAPSPLPGRELERPTLPALSDDASFFRVLTAQVERIETLSLAALPHRRAVFEGSQARWIAP